MKLWMLIFFEAKIRWLLVYVFGPVWECMMHLFVSLFVLMGSSEQLPQMAQVAHQVLRIFVAAGPWPSHAECQTVCLQQQKLLGQIYWAFTVDTLIYFVDLCSLTYLPHKAVAEVSKDKEPIGRECAEFNWFESQLMSDSNELRVKWFGCHLIWDSNDFGCQLIWDSNDLVVNRCVPKHLCCQTSMLQELPATFSIVGS